MSRYSKDPYWLAARFESKCASCERRIEKGTRIFYYPLGKAAYCTECGEGASRRFEAERFDEETYA